MVGATAISQVICFLNNISGPSSFHVQNFTLGLYPVNKEICPEIDPERDVTFHLYTRQNPIISRILQPGNDELLYVSGINFENPTVLFFHGFTESFMTEDSQLIRRSFLEHGEYNVILTNAETLLAGLFYMNSVINVKYIGKYGAALVDYLVLRGLDISTLHVIGMSLGAHISGYVGHFVKSGRIPRITGLDPAGPIYNTLPKEERLDPSDAEFVDIIHSNRGYFGYIDSCGHIDFWPNGGGPQQPGCSIIERISRRPFSLSEIVFCEHYRSYRLFAKSINDPQRYIARSCSNYSTYLNGKCDGKEEAIMGLAVNKLSRGNFYINTGKDADGYD